jgi:hypothetical protein
VRYGVPGGLVIAGLAILAIDRSTTGAEGWAMLTGAAGATALLNGLFRIGVRGDVERGAEASARDYLTEHGDWPDEDGGEPHGRRWVLARGVVTPEMEAAEAEAAEAQAARGRADGPAAGAAPDRVAGGAPRAASAGEVPARAAAGTAAAAEPGTGADSAPR